MKKILALALLLTACHARKPETSRWTPEDSNLGLAILNVYTTAKLADGIVLVPGSRSFQRGEAVVTVTYDPAVPSLRVLERRPERAERLLELRPIKEGVVGLNGQGRIILYSRRVGERVVVSDNEANIIRVYEADEIARL